MRTRLFATMGRCVAVLGVATAFGAGVPSIAQAAVPTCTGTNDPTCACTETVADFATYTTCTGTLSDFARYAVAVPVDWNGALILNSQPYVPPYITAALSPRNFVDPLTRRWVLGNGYALAASYSGSGWVVEQALEDQIETLDTFN